MLKKKTSPYRQVKELIENERLHIVLSRDKRINLMRQLSPIELINCVENLLYKYEELFRSQNRFEDYKIKIDSLTGEYDVFDAVDIDDAQEVWKEYLGKLLELKKSTEEEEEEEKPEAGLGSALKNLYDEQSGKGKKGVLQGPINDIFYKPNLLAVYGTIGSEKKCSERLKDNAISFADTISRKIRMKINVKRDVKVTSEDIKNSHIILFGGPGFNDLAEEIYDELPIPLSRDMIEIEDLEFNKEDTKIIMLSSNPLNPKKYLLIYSAVGYMGMIDLWGLYHGPTDFVVGNNFNWLARGNFNKSDSTFWQYETDLLEVNSSLLDLMNMYGWKNTLSEHYKFYFSSNSFAAKNINSIMNMHEKNYSKLIRNSGLKKGEKVEVYIYETNDKKEEIVGIRSDASFDPHSPKIHLVYNEPIVEYGPEKILESFYRRVVWSKQY